ncbi:neutral/alkaline non-lysosomal ceramidase N-terminal domain-containing protein [candidate division KSB1 bacterium]
MKIDFIFQKLIRAAVFSLVLMLMSTCFNPVRAEAQEFGSRLQAGLAKTDITPSESLYMGGYALRENPSDGVFGKLFIRTLVFDDGQKQLAIVESDIIDYPDSESLRNLIATETGIPVDHILLGSVHNHSAPVLGGRNEDSKWDGAFAGKLVETVRAAIKDLEPVRIASGSGYSRIGLNRRKVVEGSISQKTFDENYFSQFYGEHQTDSPVEIVEPGGVIRLGANPEGPIDDEVGVMRIDSMDGTPKGIFVSYACHGTSLGGRNDSVSPEWMGHMLERVEEKLPGVTGIFAQGACGDINPRFVGGLEGYEDNLENTAALGYEISREVVRVFEGCLTAEAIDPTIRLVHKDILCPRHYRELSKNFRNTTVTVPTTAVRIDNFTLVSFPGELFHEIGLRIKAAAPTGSACVIGYCNGHLGYLPTQKAFSEGGYEPAGSQFAPVSEQVYVEEVKKMLIELY